MKRSSAHTKILGNEKDETHGRDGEPRPCTCGDSKFCNEVYIEAEFSLGFNESKISVRNIREPVESADRATMKRSMGSSVRLTEAHM